MSRMCSHPRVATPSAWEAYWGVSAVWCDIDHVEGRVLVRVIGELSLSPAPLIRTRLLKCLRERPAAVVADLAALTVSEPQALSVFSAVARQAALWPGT